MEMATATTAGRSNAYWFATGMRGIYSLPALILMSSFVGFCAFAVQSGVSRGEAAFMVGAVWALPSKMILVGSATGGAGLLASFIAVALSAIRLMPMVAALIPEIKTERTPTWLLLFLSHFIAVTAWVFTMQRIKDVPRDRRIAFFAGFGMTLTTANIILVTVCFGVVSDLPPILAGALFFLTPIYFLTSLWASAQHPVVNIALLTGLVAGPVFTILAPGFDILYAGLAGGTAAYVIDRVRRKGWGTR